MFGSKSNDEAFFAAFSAHAAKTVDAAKMLADLTKHLESPPGESKGAYLGMATDGEISEAAREQRTNLCRNIKSVETAGDKITHETMKRLRENWITPLDRSDIRDLISSMDDVLDYVEEAADRIVLFDVRAAPPEAPELAEILVCSCETLAKAIGLLRDMKHAPDVLALCVEVNRLENAADAVHRRAVADLFRAGNDPLMAMKWRDIFDSLESAADSCEDVANVVEGVVLEYA